MSDHPVNPFKTQEFKKLKARWYRKLHASGFQDIEARVTTVTEEYSLRVHHDRYFKFKHSLTELQQTGDYYYLAAQLLNSVRFRNPRDREVWRLHSEGYSYRGIADQLQMNKDVVGHIVNRYQKCIKISK